MGAVLPDTQHWGPYFWMAQQPEPSHDLTGTELKNTKNTCQVLEILRCAPCCGHQMPTSWDETEKYLATLDNSFFKFSFSLHHRTKEVRGQTSRTCSPVAFAHPGTVLKIWVVFEEGYFKFPNQWTGPVGRTLVTARPPKMIILCNRRNKEIPNTETHK